MLAVLGLCLTMRVTSSGTRLRGLARATQLRRSVAEVANRWRYCADFTGPGIEPQTSRADSNERLTTELTAGMNRLFTSKIS